jgi:hypothetical protein
MPTWIRSSSSTLAGSLAIIWWARRRTSGLYCLSNALASRRPLAVYIEVQVAGGRGPALAVYMAPRRWDSSFIEV